MFTGAFSIFNRTRISHRTGTKTTHANSFHSNSKEPLNRQRQQHGWAFISVLCSFHRAHSWKHTVNDRMLQRFIKLATVQEATCSASPSAAHYLSFSLWLFVSCAQAVGLAVRAITVFDTQTDDLHSLPSTWRSFWLVAGPRLYFRPVHLASVRIKYGNQLPEVWFLFGRCTSLANCKWECSIPDYQIRRNLRSDDHWLLAALALSNICADKRHVFDPWDKCTLTSTRYQQAKWELYFYDCYDKIVNELALSVSCRRWREKRKEATHLCIWLFDRALSACVCVCVLSSIPFHFWMVILFIPFHIYTFLMTFFFITYNDDILINWQSVSVSLCRRHRHHFEVVFHKIGSRSSFLSSIPNFVRNHTGERKQTTIRRKKFGSVTIS